MHSRINFGPGWTFGNALAMGASLSPVKSPVKTGLMKIKQYHAMAGIVH